MLTHQNRSIKMVEELRNQGTKAGNPSYINMKNTVNKSHQLQKTC